MSHLDIKPGERSSEFEGVDKTEMNAYLDRCHSRPCFIAALLSLTVTSGADHHRDPS